ncbi:MAG: outer membrane lipoprotein chaperone LolA [Deltaproteobacteria bacterium]|nr:outer membrane lipoprotein chaperone LolA [Deltaproteobacteria bacterium]
MEHATPGEKSSSEDGITIPAVDAVIAKLKGRFSGVTSLTADFTQEVKSGSTPMGRLTGKVTLKRPGARELLSSMKWVYSNGDTITSDGHTTWVYQPDLNQVIESKGAPGSVAADFLTGMGDVKKSFTVSLDEKRKDAFVLRLAPKTGENNVKRVTLEISRTDYLVKKSIVEDWFGTLTEIEFSGMRLNEPVAAGLFDFKPPKGARVVRP